MRPTIQEMIQNLRDVLENAESSRERSIVLTKLDEVEMWANKGGLS